MKELTILKPYSKVTNCFERAGSNCVLLKLFQRSLTLCLPLGTFKLPLKFHWNVVLVFCGPRRARDAARPTRLTLSLAVMAPQYTGVLNLVYVNQVITGKYLFIDHPQRFNAS